MLHKETLSGLCYQLFYLLHCRLLLINTISKVKSFPSFPSINSSPMVCADESPQFSASHSISFLPLYSPSLPMLSLSHYLPQILDVSLNIEYWRWNSQDPYSLSISLLRVLILSGLPHEMCSFELASKPRNVICLRSDFNLCL